MLPRSVPRVALVLLVLSLLSLQWVPVARAATTSVSIPTAAGIELGYSPFNLYSADVGTPVYLPGESLWVYAPSPLSFTLYDASGGMEASMNTSAAPVLLHTFGRSEAGGTWSLRVDTLGAPRAAVTVLAVQYLKSGVTAQSGSTSFGISDGAVSVSGNLTFSSTPDFSSVVLLTRQSDNYTTIVNTNFRVGSGYLLARASYDETKGVVVVSPFLSSNGTVPDAVFWAALSTDVALIKQTVGPSVSGPSSSILTYVQDTVLGTDRVVATLGSEPVQSVSIGLPGPSSPELGAFPFRYGSADILLSVEISDTIYLVRIPFFILPTGNGLDIVGTRQSNPGRLVNFSFSDPAPDSGKYDVFVVAQKDGASFVWNSTITAPLARVTVYNDLLNRTESDFDVHLGNGVQGATIGQEFFALAPADSAGVSYTLVYGGLRLDPQDVSPSTLTLKAGAETVIHMRAGFVSFEVTNETGSIIGDGSISVDRVDQGVTQFAAAIQLYPIDLNDTGDEGVDQGFPLATLPVGHYVATVDALGQNQTKEFDVGNASSIVQFVLNNQTAPTGWAALGSGAPLLLSLAVIIAAESYVAVVVWRRALGT